MRFTIEEYSNEYKMSKEMINSKIKAKKLNYIIEDGITYIVVPKSKIDNKDSSSTRVDTKSNEKDTTKVRTKVGTILSLYQKENQALKDKIERLEAKIDSLITDKENMLIAERDRIESIYKTKDEQVKSIIELFDAKMKADLLAHNVEKVEDVDIIDDVQLIELKEYLKKLNLKSSQKKLIKKRFLNSYGSDVRVIQQNGAFYLDFSKYDYSDLLEI